MTIETNCEAEMPKRSKPDNRVYAIALDDVLDERVVTIRRGAEY
jgi:hypothetical protein